MQGGKSVRCLLERGDSWPQQSRGFLFFPNRRPYCSQCIRVCSGNGKELLDKETPPCRRGCSIMNQGKSRLKTHSKSRDPFVCTLTQSDNCCVIFISLYSPINVFQRATGRNILTSVIFHRSGLTKRFLLHKLLNYDKWVKKGLISSQRDLGWSLQSKTDSGTVQALVFPNPSNF